MSRPMYRKQTSTSRLTAGKARSAQPLPHDLQQALKRLLLTISKGERSIERQRQKLAKQESFEPYAAFMRVDRDENGVIGSVEILRFLRENGVEEATEADCHLIVRYFDSDGDGYLNFQDFLQLLLPCDNQTLRAIVSQRPNYPVSRTDFLGTEIEADLTRLFEKEIAFNRVTEEMKQQLEASKSWEPSRAFASIDDWGYGYIDRRNLKTFLKKHGYLATTDDVVAIIRRMDLDADARLTRQEFIDGIKPEEPYSKAMKRQASHSRKRNKTPTFNRHSRKNSAVSRQQLQQMRIDDKGIDMLMLTDQQRDPIRVQALDRSIKRISSSRSPLKGRPVMREVDDQYRFHTPKAGGRQRFQSLPRTPNSLKCGSYSANHRNYSGGRNNSIFSARRNFSRQKLCYNDRKSKPLTSMGTYSISRMMKPGLGRQQVHNTYSNKNTYRKCRDQLITQSYNSNGRTGRTYNLQNEERSGRRKYADDCSVEDTGRGKSSEYEPISRSFIEGGGAKQGNGVEKSERTRATRGAIDETYVARTHQWPNVMDDESVQAMSTQQLNSRRGPAGTSNFGNESLNSTMQINNITTAQRGYDNHQNQLSNMNSHHLRQSHQSSYQNPIQQERKYIDDHSPNSKSIQSHYSMLRGREGVVPVSETLNHDYSHKSIPQCQSERNVVDNRSSRRSGPVENRENIALMNVFQDFIRLEKDLERLKVEITLRDDYNLIDAFGLLDEQGKGYISPVELREALAEMGLKFNIDEIHLAFERFNTLGDGLLKYSEFSEGMMPQDQHYARLLGTKKLQFITKVGMCPFEEGTIQKYMQIWGIIIQNEKAADSIRQRLQKRDNFDILQAFRQCDINHDDTITLSEVRQFLFEMDCYVSSDDLQLLMNRFDKNRDGRITFQEFENELTAKSPFSY